MVSELSENPKTIEEIRANAKTEIDRLKVDALRKIETIRTSYAVT